jgi:hypothetical protein
MGGCGASATRCQAAVTGGAWSWRGRAACGQHVANGAVEERGWSAGGPQNGWLAGSPGDAYRYQHGRRGRGMLLLLRFRVPRSTFHVFPPQQCTVNSEQVEQEPDPAHARRVSALCDCLNVRARRSRPAPIAPPSHSSLAESGVACHGPALPAPCRVCVGGDMAQAILCEALLPSLLADLVLIHRPCRSSWVSS